MTKRRRLLHRRSDQELFADRDDPLTREVIVRRYDGLARRYAARYVGRGEPFADLVQAARVALVEAVDRFDPSRGVRFRTYAASVMHGAIKRHFRDHGWAMRVPRSIQERYLQVRAAKESLAQELGEIPTVHAIAGATDLEPHEVEEALAAGRAYSLDSLDAPSGQDNVEPKRARLGSRDRRLLRSADRVDAADRIGQLPLRRRRILFKRFFEGKSQREIADDIGISQMHVSRLLRDSLEQVSEDDGEEPSNEA